MIYDIHFISMHCFYEVTFCSWTFGCIKNQNDFWFYLFTLYRGILSLVLKFTRNQLLRIMVKSMSHKSNYIEHLIDNRAAASNTSAAKVVKK